MSKQETAAENHLKWDKRFLELAKMIASWSKDPSTKTGAVIVNDRRIVSIGFNGLPSGVADLDERYNNRETKYKMIVHCERNAIIFARESLAGYTLYTWPFMSCCPCAGLVINSGITRCVAPPCTEEQRKRWGTDFEITETMFKEAGVKLDLIEI